MEDNTSKNIIIIILSLLVIGLLVILFVAPVENVGQNKAEQSDTLVEDEEEVGSNEEAEEETAAEDTEENNVASTPPPTQAPPPVPTPEVTAPPQTNIADIQLEESMVIVTYTDSGFIPPVVEVVAGNSVTFINSSSKPMWVTSENHPTAKAQRYPGFAQSKSVSTGGTYSFSFTQIGVWGYKNLNQEKHLGAISVIAQ